MLEAAAFFIGFIDFGFLSSSAYGPKTTFGFDNSGSITNTNGFSFCCTEAEATLIGKASMARAINAAR